MSILIKGAEMPKSCWDCELGSAQQLDGRPCPFYSADFSEQKKYSDKSADGCPLVPVPPHGRLIDGDAFMKDECNHCDGACEAIPCNCLTCKSSCRCDLMLDLINAPTIIPAEEGE